MKKTPLLLAVLLSTAAFAQTDKPEILRAWQESRGVTQVGTPYLYMGGSSVASLSLTYEFPGKTPSLPKTVAVKLDSDYHSAPSWKNLKTARFDWANGAKRGQIVGSVTAYSVDKDFSGVSSDVTERISFGIKPEELRALGGAKFVKLTAGKDEFRLPAKMIENIRLLAQALPAK